MGIHSAHIIYLYPEEVRKIITITGDTYTYATIFYSKLLKHHTLATLIRQKAKEEYIAFVDETLKNRIHNSE